MKTLTPGRLLGVLLLLALAVPAFAQNSIVGTWRTIDDETGEPKSLVRIYERGGAFFGDIVQLLPDGRLCTDCADAYDGRDLRGLNIIRDLRPNGAEWTGGRIINPQSGRTYRLKARLDGANRLRLRGFLGISAIGRNQTWERVR